MAPDQVSLFVDFEEIVLTKNGVWLSNGEEITHGEQLKAFAKNLKHDAEGYSIEIGRDQKRISVEDTAYFVTRVDGTPDEGFIVTLNDGSTEDLDPKSLRYQPARLTCIVMRHGQMEEAKFLSTAYFDFLKNLESENGEYFLVIQGSRIALK
jgi:hypothetical protein